MNTGEPLPAVFLDRDGVLNYAPVRDGVPHPPTTLDELVVLPGVPEACQCLREHGFVLVIVTNQPDIARGSGDPATVEAINARLLDTLPLDAIYCCPHDDPDGCDCRKPAPGMMIAAALDHNLDLRKSYLVGDRWRDIEAGRRAGCTTVRIDHNYSEPSQEGADATVSDLREASEWILKDAETKRTSRD